MRTLGFVVAAACLSAPLAADEDGRPRVLAAMRDELSRSMARLQLADYEKPYFIAYTVRDYDGFELSGRLGALFTDERRRNRHAFVEVRVGSYQLDNSGSEHEISIDLDEPEAYEP